MQVWWIWLKKQILLYNEVVSWQNLFVEYSAENCTGIKSGLKLQTLSDSYPLSHTWRVGKQRRDACFLHFLKVHIIANYVFYWNDFTPWVFLNTDILSRKKGSSPISTSIQLSHRKKQQDKITLCFCWDKYLFFKFLQVPLNVGHTLPYPSPFYFLTSDPTTLHPYSSTCSHSITQSFFWYN